jgi:branched-chain amino acid transport system substrate-binding protein
MARRYLRTRVVPPLLLALVGLLGTELFATSANASSSGTVTIGVSEMLTGGSALYGHAVLQGVDLAENQINAGGGVLGKKIVLEVKDDASDNAEASTIMRDFAQQSNIAVTIAPTYQSNFNAACAVSNELKIPAVAAQSGPPDAANDTDHYCYTLTVNPDAQVSTTLEDLSELGYHKLLMVYDNSNGYVAFAKPIIEAVAKSDHVSLQEISVDAPSTLNFATTITQAISDKPDAVFPFMTIEDAARFMEQARALGLKVPFFDPISSLTSRRLVPLSKNAAVGLIAVTAQSPGNVANFAAFESQYTAHYHAVLDDPTYTGYGYDALELIAHAMTLAKTTTSRTAIQHAIYTLKSACFSVCYANGNDGAFFADHFYLVKLTASDGFVPLRA